MKHNRKQKRRALSRDGLPANPFSNDYFEKEYRQFSRQYKNIPLLNSRVLNKHKALDMKIKDVNGLMEGYMYKEMVRLREIPVLTMKDAIVTSLSPMEVESQYMPIELAFGRVGVAGLGMGYYVDSIVDKDDVQEIIVYEPNKALIDLYYDMKHSLINRKIKILNRDIKYVHGEKFDFFFNNSYEEPYDYSAIEDLSHICSRNEVREYHWWTMEAFIQSALSSLEGNVNEHTMKALCYDVPRLWIKTYIPFLKELENEKGNYYFNDLDCYKVLSEMRKHKITSLF